MKYNIKLSIKDKGKPDFFRIHMQMNIMRGTLQGYFRHPHIQGNLHRIAGHRLEELRRKFTRPQLEHLSQRLLSWLQWNTGKYRRTTPFVPSEICERAMRKMRPLSLEHCLGLVILVAEYQAKPVRQ